MLREFISMLFPDFCLACHEALVRGEVMICTSCRYNLPQTDYHLHPENELLAKFSSKFLLKYTLAYLKFTKNGQVQRLMHALKYNASPEVGEILGHWYGHILKEHQFDQEFDGIVPVPLHPDKLKKRGYNQSACFAKGLSESLEIPVCENALARSKVTESQTRKGKLERWYNVKDVFVVPEPALVTDCRLLLVDDVLTTGSTLESCLDILHRHQSRELSIATIAVAQ